MTYTATQLDIIKTFGRKIQDENCLFIVDGKVRKLSNLEYQNIKDSGKQIETIGQIPHLEDVFRFAQNKNWYITVHNARLWIEKESNKPVIMGTSYEIIFDILYKSELSLLEQPESTLLELLTLFK